MIVPLFKSHYSTLKSILTLEELGKSEEGGPDSIIDIANELKLNEVYLVEDGMSALLPAYLTLQKIGASLRYGYRVSFVNDCLDKVNNPLDGEHKNIIFALNEKGRIALTKIANKCAWDFYCKIPRVDYSHLAEMWDENLLLAVPFYDSFIYRNNFQLKSCIPNFSKISPVFFVEDNDLPFDSLLEKEVRKFASSGNYPVVKTKSIYYKNREDFVAWQTLKIMNRKEYSGKPRTLENPNLEHCSSREFCVESYLEKCQIS